MSLFTDISKNMDKMWFQNPFTPEEYSLVKNVLTLIKDENVYLSSFA